MRDKSLRMMSLESAVSISLKMLRNRADRKKLASVAYSSSLPEASGLRLAATSIRNPEFLSEIVRGQVASWVM